MNVYYAKSLLYAYSNLEKVMEQIDELVEKRALSSISDVSPAIYQYEKILLLTEQKDVLIVLKKKMDDVLKRFSASDLDYFDYKYFKVKPRECFIEFDFTSRAYFRRQNKLVAKFSERMEKAGVDDEWFKKYCCSTEFFKELLKRVIEHEKLFNKNKSKNSGVPKVKSQKSIA